MIKPGIITRILTILYSWRPGWFLLLVYSMAKTDLWLLPETVADGVLRLHRVEEGGAEVIDGVDAGGPPGALLCR
jgi:hypothetical protein